MAEQVKEGDRAPMFTLPTDGGGTVSLKALRGKAAVIYFYPKDLTSGCTAEALDFSAKVGDFSGLNAQIIGISADTPSRHDKFKDKHALAFILASDEDRTVCGAYGVWVEKSMYGRTYFGIERSTFLIGPDGTIQRVWRKVKVKEHAGEVLEAVRKLAE